MKILASLKRLVRGSTIAMAVTVSMTTTTMIASQDAYAFPHLSFGRIAELTHFQHLEKLGEGLTFGGLPVGLIAGGALLSIDSPAAAVLVAGIGVAVTIGGLATWIDAHHQVGRIDGNDRWFLDLNNRQRHRFFPGYYDPGSSVARNADTRSNRGGAPTTLTPGPANNGFHH